jgi:hypothetical protein
MCHALIKTQKVKNATATTVAVVEDFAPHVDFLWLARSLGGIARGCRDEYELS